MVTILISAVFIDAALIRAKALNRGSVWIPKGAALIRGNTVC